MRPDQVDIAKLAHLLEVLRGRCFTPHGDSIPLRWTTAASDQRDSIVNGSMQDWPRVTTETVWGAPQSYFWFAGQAVIPPELAGQRVYLWIDAQFGRVMGRSDPQCLIRVNGDIRQGADFNHREMLLTADATAGEVFELMIEAGTIEDRRQLGFGCNLMVHDALAEAVYFDLKTPLDVAKHLPETDHRRDLIVSRVHRALAAIDLRRGSQERFHASLRHAQDIGTEIYSAADTDITPQVTVTGHTHIDVAWLWRVRETRQKMARSIATALTLMEEYPDYQFMYNQGYLLDTLEQDYPSLFDGIVAQQKAGRFEIEGALWLEPDANMTGGESLVRQILRGVRYHQQTFGVTPKIVWLPDTFGYSAALPQIMKLAGLEVFVTHKMSWNDTNRMPFETFFWQGIDGTKVPTYFLTTQPMESTTIGTTYCPDLKASHVMGAWRRYAQKATQDEVFLVYGHGDGGGGPTREMLEHIARMERGIPGCPRVTHDHMGPYFDRLLAKMRDAPADYPTWVGELYLEFHRGTFTSVAEVKRNNRKAEMTLRELEALAVLAQVQRGHPYPRAELGALWDIALLNQFHDILPGSSIKEVYEDSAAEFEAFFEQAVNLRERLSKSLGGGSIFNALGSTHEGLVTLPEAVAASVQGVQQLVFADGSTANAVKASIPALSAAPVSTSALPASTSELHVSERQLENAHILMRLDNAGRIISLLDKATGREALTGPGNRLQAFRDLPAQFDAWDIDQTYTDQVWEIDDLQSAEIVERGPLRAAIRLEWGYEASRIVQVISLGADDRQIEIDTWADWRDQNTLVKAAFPLSVRSDCVHAEMQFGHVTRPTHTNTSWDAARFECPMHRWVAMSEAGFGVAILNDCKYGNDASGQELRITLLRAPTWPWDGADIGEHRFRYAVMPFDDFECVSSAAERFNHPLTYTVADGAVSTGPEIVSLSHDGVAIGAMKLAEDDDAIILRLWERHGKAQTVKARFCASVTDVAICDLLERATEPLSVTEGAVDLSFNPFEIKSLRLNWTA
ncbi:alpha-mannosidase [Flavimaricola marinus]|uniref:Mannosylglycerate hydrolase n=1 Tax=Flavimaricola marinus TaxID=1819565 RepID=A0A238LC27_9RHOB|nr:glycoside hydrolase family 38 C-terminal domain-containing protein [Flavimaricola marinus]SMY07277.1 Mannosylglycerate hydrolase [Flavimaricola marinus]